LKCSAGKTKNSADEEDTIALKYRFSFFLTNSSKPNNSSAPTQQSTSFLKVASFFQVFLAVCGLLSYFKHNSCNSADPERLNFCDDFLFV